MIGWREFSRLEADITVNRALVGRLRKDLAEVSGEIKWIRGHMAGRAEGVAKYGALKAAVEAVAVAWVAAAGEATDAHPAQKAAVRAITAELRAALAVSEGDE